MQNTDQLPVRGVGCVAELVGRVRVDKPAQAQELAEALPPIEPQLGRTAIIIQDGLCPDVRSPGRRTSPRGHGDDGRRPYSHFGDRELHRLLLRPKGCLSAALQKGLGIEFAKDFDHERDAPSPSRLVAGAEVSAVVAVEVFVEQ